MSPTDLGTSPTDSQLGSYYRHEFMKTKALSDILASIHHTHSALSKESINTPCYLNLQCDLGVRLALKWIYCVGARTPEDLTEAKDCLEAVLAAVPKDSPSRNNFLKNTAIVLGMLYTNGGYEGEEKKMKLLSRLIQVHEELKEVTGKFEAVVVAFYAEHYETTRDLEVVAGAVKIAVAEQLVEWVPKDQIAWCQAVLCNILRMRYEHTGDLRDLDRAIVLGRLAVGVDPRELTGRLHLGNALGCLYRARGNIDDLEECIRLLNETRQAAKKEGDQDFQGSASINLSQFLVTRYERMGELADVEAALKWAEEAVHATSDSAIRANRLNNLSIVWGRYYERTANVEHLQNAIQKSKAARGLAPAHRDASRHLNSLGIWLGWRFEANRKANRVDLDEAIEKTECAVELVTKKSPDSVELGLYLGNLCRLLGWKYEVSKNSDLLDRAIKRGEESLSITPTESLGRIRVLWNLGVQLEARFEITKDPADLNRAKELLKEASFNPDAPPAYRLNVVVGTTKILRKYNDLAAALEVARTGVRLLALASSRSAQQTDQQDILQRYAGLASETAALVLECEGSPEEAAAQLEQGRGIIAYHHYQSRSDLTELSQKYPAEAQEFRCLRDLLFSGTASPELETFVESSSGRHNANRSLDLLIKHIQTLDGFERFLTPPGAEKLHEAAEKCNQTIIMINIAFRCDAFIIHNGSITCLPLPSVTTSLTEKKLREWQRANVYVCCNILEWLWNALADPILSKLGHVSCRFPGKSEANKWPRICWIPTASLCRLPLHAAGCYYKGKPGHSVLDRVISSYSVSVKALIYTHQNSARASQSLDENSTQGLNALLVSMHTTPELRDLPKAKEEIQALATCLRGYSQLSSVNALYTPDHKSVVAGLPKCQIFHFAGHGATKAFNAAQSSLVLSDGNLTVSNLQDLHLHAAPPLLAYLSACSTGFNPNTQLLDEGIHLMAACQVAGFQNVVGTLWVVSDKFCVYVALEVYRAMLEDRCDVAEALHIAVRKGRDGMFNGEGISGTRDAVSDDEDPAPVNVKDPKLWAAYIHTGM